MAQTSDAAVAGNAKVFRLRNSVQHYAWGGREFIPRILGLDNAKNEPWAELWMGDHPLAPSSALFPDGREASLGALIAGNPAYHLSNPATARLPYLFKLLSAAEPLSLQAHPSREQAERGFAREEARGLAPDSPERFYKDRNHKPEIVVALEPFSALCGFKEAADIRDSFFLLAKAARGIPGGVLASVASRAASLLGEGPGALGDFYRWLGSLPAANAKAAALEAARLARDPAAFIPGEGSPWDCLRYLASRYPGDPGIFAALYLNHLRLEALQGFFVPADVLHSYLGGSAMELMASSDNVLRGGLSPKKVDIAAMTEILDFAPFKPRILAAAESGSGWSSYGRLCPDFELALATGHASRQGREPEILFCLEGDYSLSPEGEGALALKAGDSVFLPAASGDYRLQGGGLLFRARPGSAVH